MGNIIKTAHNPDHVLEQAKGNYAQVLIVGFNHDGEHDTRASLNVDGKMALWLVEAFKARLMSGEYAPE